MISVAKISAAPSDLEAAFDLLPWWVLWARSAFGLGLLAITLVAVHAVLERGHRRACARREEHWTERARRVANRPRVATWGILIAGFGAVLLLNDESITYLELRLRLLGVLAIVVLVVVVFQYRFYRMASRHPLGLARFLRGMISTVLVLMLQLLCVTAVLFLAPLTMSWSAVVCSWIALCAIMCFSVHVGTWIASCLGLASRVTSELQLLVDRAGHAVGHGPCRAFRFAGLVPNAFALTMPPVALLFTDRILELLDDRELEAIAHHEFGHLLEDRRILVVRALPLIGAAALAFAGPLWFMVGPWALAGLAVLVVFLAVVAGSMSKKLEARADAHAHRAGDEALYARALEKMYEDSGAPAVVGRRNRTHPELYDRLLDAGVVPDYARPDPPVRYAAASFAVALVALVIMACGYWFTQKAIDPGLHPEIAIALQRDPAPALFVLAERAAPERPREAIVYLRACDISDDEMRVDVPAYLAVLHHDLGERNAALEELELAEARLEDWVEHRPASRSAVEEWIAWARRRMGLSAK